MRAGGRSGAARPAPAAQLVRLGARQRRLINGRPFRAGSEFKLGRPAGRRGAVRSLTSRSGLLGGAEVGACWRRELARLNFGNCTERGEPRRDLSARLETKARAGLVGHLFLAKLGGFKLRRESSSSSTSCSSWPSWPESAHLPARGPKLMILRAQEAGAPSGPRFGAPRSAQVDKFLIISRPAPAEAAAGEIAAGRQFASWPGRLGARIGGAGGQQRPASLSACPAGAAQAD